MATSWLRKSWLRRRGAELRSNAQLKAGREQYADDEKLWYLPHLDGEPHGEGRRLMLRFTHQDLASIAACQAGGC